MQIYAFSDHGEGREWSILLAPKPCQLGQGTLIGRATAETLDHEIARLARQYLGQPVEHEVIEFAHPLMTYRTCWTPPEWIAHLNAIGVLEGSRRDLLREQCERSGHTPGPEHFLTATLIYVCSWCGDEFQADPQIPRLR